ncbi:hypothetical protein L1887_08239 [Cichorium endivia]|nr:hypothetical protein L1887_08239 [Cichorium endivia]
MIGWRSLQGLFDLPLTGSSKRQCLTRIHRRILNRRRLACGRDPSAVATGASAAPSRASTAVSALVVVAAPSPPVKSRCFRCREYMVLRSLMRN